MSYAYNQRKKNKNKNRKNLPDLLRAGQFPMVLLPQQLAEMGQDKAADTIEKHEEAKAMLKKLIRQGKATRFIMVRHKGKVICNGRFKRPDGTFVKVGPFTPQVNALSVYT